jgi:hypothetical protein
MWLHFLSALPARAFRLFSFALVTSLVSACGGGAGGGGDDGETLSVTFAYTGSLQLLRPSAMAPQTSGFNGRAPNCVLVSGRMPTGLALGSDCTISGAALESGAFPFVVSVGASGVSNRLEFQGSALVFGPSVTYVLPDADNSLFRQYVVGDQIDIAPVNAIFWSPGPATRITYSIESGQLPPGLSINTVTGHITGHIQGVGTYTFTVAARVEEGGHVATASHAGYYMPVALGNQQIYPSDVQTMMTTALSQPANLPAIAGATYTFTAINLTTPGKGLPAGLSLDPATGTLSGNATEGPGREQFNIRTTVLIAGISSQIDTPVWIETVSPVDFIYVFGQRLANQPAMWPLEIRPNVTRPDLVLNYSFRIDPATPLPAGLSIDPATGTVSGTATQTFIGDIGVIASVSGDQGATFERTIVLSMLIN